MGMAVRRVETTVLFLVLSAYQDGYILQSPGSGQDLPHHIKGNAQVMLIGVGNDIVDIERIRAVLDRQGERFIQRVLRPGERAYCERRHDFVAALARHYSLKQAAVKALGTGFRFGVGWRDVGLDRPEPGKAFSKPRLTFEGGALVRVQAMLREGEEVVADWSMSDEPPYATAFVVLFATAKGSETGPRAHSIAPT